MKFSGYFCVLQGQKEGSYRYCLNSISLSDAVQFNAVVYCVQCLSPTSSKSRWKLSCNLPGIFCNLSLNFAWDFRLAVSRMIGYYGIPHFTPPASTTPVAGRQCADYPHNVLSRQLPVRLSLTVQSCGVVPRLLTMHRSPHYNTW